MTHSSILKIGVFFPLKGQDFDGCGWERSYYSAFFISKTVNTHKQQSEVAALQRLEQVCDSCLQTSADEDAVAEVIQQDGSEGVDVSWKKKCKSQTIYRS